jgi:putative membrane protein
MLASKSRPNPASTNMNSRSLHLSLLSLVVLAMAVSAYQPFDRATWYLEVAPVLIAIPLLWFTYARFPLTNLLYMLIAIHALILIVGGHYTYARVPLGYWVQDALDLSRNHYDRLGHVAQGFIPAMVARELLQRLTALRPGVWLFFLVTCVALAISAFYELIEWWVALAMGGAADEFLATQGDIWDTQWDMFLALCGALLAQLTLARVQDRQMAALNRV